MLTCIETITLTSGHIPHPFFLGQPAVLLVYHKRETRIFLFYCILWFAIYNGLSLMGSPSENWGSPGIMLSYSDRCMTILYYPGGQQHTVLGKFTSISHIYTLHSYAAQNILMSLWCSFCMSVCCDTAQPKTRFTADLLSLLFHLCCCLGKGEGDVSLFYLTFLRVLLIQDQHST